MQPALFPAEHFPSMSLFAIVLKLLLETDPEELTKTIPMELCYLFLLTSFLLMKHPAVGFFHPPPWQPSQRCGRVLTHFPHFLLPPSYFSPPPAHAQIQKGPLHVRSQAENPVLHVTTISGAPHSPSLQHSAFFSAGQFQH